MIQEERKNKFTLTMNHAASSYGQPILLLNGIAYGPGDRIESDFYGSRIAAELIFSHCLLKRGLLNREFWDKARKFCALGGMGLSEFSQGESNGYPGH